MNDGFDKKVTQKIHSSTRVHVQCTVMIYYATVILLFNRIH